MPDSLKIRCEDGRVLEVPEESAEKLLFLIQTMNSPDAVRSPAFAQLRRALSRDLGLTLEQVDETLRRLGNSLEGVLVQGTQDPDDL